MEFKRHPYTSNHDGSGICQICGQLQNHQWHQSADRPTPGDATIAEVRHARAWQRKYELAVKEIDKLAPTVLALEEELTRLRAGVNDTARTCQCAAFGMRHRPDQCARMNDGALARIASEAYWSNTRLPHDGPWLEVIKAVRAAIARGQG